MSLPSARAARRCALRRTNGAQRETLAQEFADTASAIKEDRYTPVILYRNSKPVDFTYRLIAQYGAETQVETREDFSSLLDEFYDAREATRSFPLVAAAS